MKAKDISGNRYGRTVACTYRGGGYWLCRCDCGSEHITTSNRLNSGATKSCGCYRRDVRLANAHNLKKRKRKYSHYSDHLKTKVKKLGADECWLWTGAKSKFGYGVIWANGRGRAVHRVVYEMTFGHQIGSLPRSLVVMHRCDNPSCCNPRHLVLGTQAENNKDRAAKGRTQTRMLPRTEHPMAKLTEEAIAEIRSTARRYGTGAALARKYGVSESTISAVRTGASWLERSERKMGRSAT